MRTFNLNWFFVFFIFFSFSKGQAQEKTNYQVFSIAFYNQENLFDTQDDPEKRDGDFLPSGSYKWTNSRYEQKLHNMSTIIAKIGADKAGIPPTGIGLSEVENRKVVEDLIAQPALSPYPYDIAHIESPDKRGIDVAFVYRKDLINVHKVSARELKIQKTYAGDNWEFATRNQLIVEATMGGEEFAFIVNHWPSRGAPSWYREKAGDLNRSIIDSLRTITPNLHIVTMGDFNDDPNDKSISKSLGAVGNAKKLNDKNYLYNPMFNMHKSGLGTLAYRDSWNLFDQIIISKELKQDKSGVFFYKAEIENFPELKSKEGRYKGYPFRTYSGGNYSGGYSDHFPVVIYLLKKQP